MNKENFGHAFYAMAVFHLLFFLFMTIGLSAQEKAVIIYPIAEMNNSYPPTPVNSPLSPDGGYGCKRAHQGLHNELVDIVEQKDSCLKILYTNIKYRTDDNSSSFWVDEKNIVRLDDIEKLDILETIPHPVYGQESTVVLTYPWKNFSIGTRFKYIPEDSNQGVYTIVRGNYADNTVMIDSIPHDCAMQEVQQDALLARQLFVKNINDLVTRVSQDNPDHVIPYVWGGSSFVHSYIDTAFYQKNGWQREGNKNPYTGYDCSGFVMRMAQIAGIDFPWKTSTAIQRSKRVLTQDDILEEGDIIWIQGHVMIVSDIQKNELIEARGYSSGYGCIHRLRLDEIFQGVITYDDLLENYYAKKPLDLKNKKGEFVKRYDQFLLLKLID